jgi:hypothetical protein
MLSTLEGKPIRRVAREAVFKQLLKRLGDARAEEVR